MSYRKFYRYVSTSEKNNIISSREIRSRNRVGTYYTLNRFDDPTIAQQLLAIKKLPKHRVGPISRFVMPIFDVLPLRTVPPAHGYPGGGTEACTSSSLFLFGIFNFNSGTYEL